MAAKKKFWRPRVRRGSVLLHAVLLMMVLVVSGGAFMKWAADEAYQAHLDLARTQAYYIAQQGVIEQGIGYLRYYKLHQLPRSDLGLPRSESASYGGFHGYYADVHLEEDKSRELRDPEAYIRTGAWDVSARGVVEVGRGDGTVLPVERSFTIRSRMRTLASYMYLSDLETVDAPDGSGEEIVNFTSGDTLYGSVHSNDWIGIFAAPVFYGQVSTSKNDFRRNNYNPYFEYAPRFEVPEIHFPETADDVREGAEAIGTYVPDGNGACRHKLFADEDAWHWVRWEAGNGADPNDDNIIGEGTIPYTINTLAFFEGRLHVEGEAVQLRNTIGCSENMYLTDNIMYVDVAFPALEIDPESPHVLGLISEGNIVIRNNVANGSQDGGDDGYQADHDHAHIVITAGLVALGSSFTFEHQNDVNPDDITEPRPAPWDHGSYLWCPPGGPGGADERGYVFLRGSLAQQRRGFTHRSNCGGTGYYKQYEYDFRLQTNPPPVYLAAQSVDGNVFFEVTSSWDGSPGDN